MSTTYLRNSDGKVIGQIRNQGGKIYLFNRNGKRMGWYDPKNNTTFDANGNVVARNSNILVALLKN